MCSADFLFSRIWNSANIVRDDSERAILSKKIFLWKLKPRFETSKTENIISIYLRERRKKSWHVDYVGQSTGCMCLQLHHQINVSKEKRN